MRFHVISLPHTQTTKEYSLCAYTEKVRKFSNMMTKLGHEVYLYSSEENEAECTEHITIVTKKEQKKWFGDYDFRKQFFNIDWDSGKEHWTKSNDKAIQEIGKRLKPKDFICVIAGICQKQIADAFPAVMSVEFGIGYSGVFSDYRVFESYAWMHSVYGAYSNPNEIMSVQGKFYDAVIPNYFEVEDFPYSAKKDNYYLYIGRLTSLKGYDLVTQVCEKLKLRLIIAGQGEPPDYGEYVGTVGPKERGKLMSKAKAVFAPSLYLEPFGGVTAEAMLCGTPIITTDWGAFSENNIQGVTGYRCRTFKEFCQAAKDVNKLDNKFIREYAVSKFSTDVVALEYEKYFKRLLTLWGLGFYA
jgi:glycosyltransferase involved in cell wall biosynthesis